MRRRFVILLTLFVCCEVGLSTFASATDAWDINARLGRAINLGNALEAPYEGQWGVTLREEYFQIIVDGGFTGVRIPIRWNAHASKEPPYTIEPQFMDRVNWAVDNALNRGLLAIIDFHHYEELTDTADAFHQQRFLDIWAQIAEHYQDYPDELIFELLNEPHGALDASIWNNLLADAIDVIRLTNPSRNIIVGATGWNSKTKLVSSLKLPTDDRHIIATFHHYDPFHFTHQGAGWVGGNSDSWLGTTWDGTASQRKAIADAFDKVSNWSRVNDRPVFMGEFGAYSKADMDSRVLWTQFCARQAEQRDFSWSYWEFCAGFGAYDDDSGKWRRLHRALVPDAPVQNQLRNPHFDFALDHWTKRDANRSFSTASIVDDPQLATTNVLEIAISHGGSDFDDVFVKQQDIALEAGVLYRICLRARAEDFRQMRTTLRAANGAAYWSAVQDLTPQAQTFTYLFESAADNEQVVLYLGLGGSNADVWLDDISITEAWDCARLLETGLTRSTDMGGPLGVPDCRIDVHDLRAFADQWLTVDTMHTDSHDALIAWPDFVDLAKDWLECYDPQDVSCVP